MPCALYPLYGRVFVPFFLFARCYINKRNNEAGMEINGMISVPLGRLLVFEMKSSRSLPAYLDELDCHCCDRGHAPFGCGCDLANGNSHSFKPLGTHSSGSKELAGSDKGPQGGKSVGSSCDACRSSGGLRQSHSGGRPPLNCREYHHGVLERLLASRRSLSSHRLLWRHHSGHSHRLNVGSVHSLGSWQIQVTSGSHRKSDGCW